MRDGGGESDGLAPVIPLFSGKDGARAASSGIGRRGGGATGEAERSSTHSTALTGDGGNAAGEPGALHPARRGAQRAAGRLHAIRSEESAEDASSDLPSAEEHRALATESLVRRLRARSLSISEARTHLKGHEHMGIRLDGTEIEDILDEFCRRGYLDDALLAEQLVSSGSRRKGQGRVALGRSLAQRGIPRDVADAALDELPDDDAERALEFARTKARSLSRLDHDTALRRLVGQLARRGYTGQTAMSAAKSALRDGGSSHGSSGVRFVDVD